jgi:TPR repeat protein
MRDLDDFNSGEERVWNSEKVFEVIEKAGAGDVEAQYELGCFYTTGQGHLKPDMAQAFDWLSKAAAQGHAGAKEKLAEPEKVLEVIGKAEKGDAEAQYQLGCFYTTGKISLQMSTLKAAEWFNKAAAQGHNAAKQMLKPSC